MFDLPIYTLFSRHTYSSNLPILFSLKVSYALKDSFAVGMRYLIPYTFFFAAIFVFQAVVASNAASGSPPDSSSLFQLETRLIETSNAITLMSSRLDPFTARLESLSTNLNLTRDIIRSETRDIDVAVDSVVAELGKVETHLGTFGGYLNNLEKSVSCLENNIDWMKTLSGAILVITLGILGILSKYFYSADKKLGYIERFLFHNSSWIAAHNRTTVKPPYPPHIRRFDGFPSSHGIRLKGSSILRDRGEI